MNESVTLCSATLGEDGKHEPPLGPLYVAAVLERLGARVDFRDYQLAPEADCFSGRRLADFLANHAKIVAVSCFVDMLPVVIDATRMLCEDNPDTTIILGGPGPSASADRILELYPWVDGVVRGEGEETIEEWMLRRRAGCDDLTPIAGMSLRRGDRIVSGSSRTRQVDLESLPAPAYHLADWDAYGYARVITTRGCAYRCSFCDVTALWGNRSVYREIDAVIDEMEFLRDVHGEERDHDRRRHVRPGSQTRQGFLPAAPRAAKPARVVVFFADQLDVARTRRDHGSRGLSIGVLRDRLGFARGARADAQDGACRGR